MEHEDNTIKQVSWLVSKFAVPLLATIPAQFWTPIAGRSLSTARLPQLGENASVGCMVCTGYRADSEPSNHANKARHRCRRSSGSYVQVSAAAATVSWQANMRRLVNFDRSSYIRLMPIALAASHSSGPDPAVVAAIIAAAISFWALI